MKKYFLSFVALSVVVGGLFFAFNTLAQIEIQIVSDQTDRFSQSKDEAAPLVSPNIVISQIYGGGGNTGAVYANDFVELFNRGTSPVSLNGWSTQYASATGTEFFVTPLSNVVLQPGQYYLIQYASSGAIGSAIPTPDVVAPAITNNAGNTFIPNLSVTTGKIVLVNSTVRLPASTCPVDPTIVDLVGYGDSASCFEGAKTPNFSNTTAGKRNGGGCVDTDNNNTDITIGAPAPRNTSSPTSTCNLGGNLQAGMSANPTTVNPSGSTLLTVTVIPATTPPSTDIQVVGDVTQIGGSSLQPFLDDGMGGDATAGDNIFSYLATLPANTTGGVKNITAVASDAQARFVNLGLNITVNAPLEGENPLLLGNPTNATSDVANENNYLMNKPQYSLSYNRSRNEPNWTAWRLDSSWIGSTSRQGDFRPDTTLPAGWYQVTPTDYSEPIYDRGHMCPSGDRTNSVLNNSATFLMTNMVPQLQDNNQGPWEDLETYCRTLAGQGNELYIISGGFGNVGTIGNGVVIPASTWKVVLVLPNGTNDLSRISKNTRTFAVIMSNQSITRNAPWRDYRTTVRGVERLTGYHFFTNVEAVTAETIKTKKDRF